MTSTDEQVALGERTEWVYCLWGRYPIPRNLIPDCWAERGWAAEELSALHVGWLVCFDE